MCFPHGESWPALFVWRATGCGDAQHTGAGDAQIVADTPEQPIAPAAAAAPQAGIPGGMEPESSEQDTPPAGESDKAETLSLETKRKLDSENRSLRSRLADAEKKLREHDEAKLTEQERLTKRTLELEGRVTQLQEENKTLRTRGAIEKACAEAKIIDPDAAYRLLDLTHLEYDPESGDPTAASVKRAVDDLATAKPYLVVKTDAPAAPQFTGTVPLAGTPRPDAGRALSAQEEERRRALVFGRVRSSL